MEREITIEKLKELLPLICDRETSQDPENWKPENPLWGHCAVVSLVAQNLFGGELLRASLEGTEFAASWSHYWNRLPDGSEEDFTKTQFGGRYPANLKAEVRERSYVLFNPETVRRYKILAFRLLGAIYGSNGFGIINPLFFDPIYRMCFDAALDSPCQKMKFGCVIRHKTEFLGQWCNKIIEPLKSLCEPKCVRFSIKSRTESMLGACGHAEEWALWDVVKKRVSLEECSLYIAGFYPNGLPWLKIQAEHTCLRCAVQMYHAKIGRIYVPVQEVEDKRLRVFKPEYINWQSMTSEEAIKTALVYATQEKIIEK